MINTNESELKFLKENLNTYGQIDNSDPLVQEVSSLADALGNVIIFKKGIVDIISDGKQSYFVAVEGGLKRCVG